MTYKPFDEKQAAQTIRDEVKRGVTYLTEELTRRGEQAIERMKAEAEVMAKIPPDIAALFAAAEAVLVDEVDLTHASRGGGTVGVNAVLRVNGGMEFYIPRLFRSSSEQATPVPAGKYRALVVLLPVTPQPQEK